ncbi:MAG: hypothetical protein M0P31_13575 [Solirubrobacteraceae bacterium]|nr:hypothetical protein [Solirubrobacteraceae bacterium]
MKLLEHPVSPGPFVAWFDGFVARHVAEDVDRVTERRAVAFAAIGWPSSLNSAERKLHRWRRQVRHVDAIEVYDALTLAGVAFDDVYDAPEFAAARAAMAATPAPVAGRKRGKPVGKWRKLTDDQVRLAHRIYVERGLSLRKLGALMYERFGYASPDSCAGALSTAFITLGLPRRDRTAATIAASTIHGLSPRGARASTDPKFSAHRAELRRARGETLDRPRCAGVRTQYPRKGRPCQQRAQAGSDYCWAHDPAHAEERDRHLEQIRARIGEAA